ncbi:hypothetical protein C360_03002 [Cryptococcus neoformans Bt15]|nr:hypothetical protein C360_03002 [Cryptococcus neoformans var. grubii Bt15]
MLSKLETNSRGSYDSYAQVILMGRITLPSHPLDALRARSTQGTVNPRNLHLLTHSDSSSSSSST